MRNCWFCGKQGYDIIDLAFIEKPSQTVFGAHRACFENSEAGDSLAEVVK